jgi:segregation and condensation protein A
MSDENETPEPPDAAAPPEAPELAAPEKLRPRRRGRKGAAAAEDAAPEASDDGAEEASLLPEAWHVHLPIFDGPLDLLLHLIKLNRVEITDIPVATICDQFHAYLQLMEVLNLDVAGEYVYEAALLIHLKSKMLLPRPPRAEGEPEEDPRQELVDRLLEYRRLKEVAQSFAEVDRLRMGIWTRKPQPLPTLPEDEEQTIDLGEVSLFDLLGALKTALVRYDREHPPPIQLSLEAYSVRGQFDRLLSFLDAGHPYDLIEDLKTRTCRAEAIATFLAVLELARLNLIRVHQTESGDILLYRTTRELGDVDREAIGV